jgi:protein involved in polysaccharide export with SLBB domain
MYRFEHSFRRALRALIFVAACSGGTARVLSAQDSGVALSAQDGVAAVAARAARALLRPGDQIELQFRRDRELNASIMVNERGEAVFPKLGAVTVSTITIGALKDTLLTRYSVYLREPEMDVTVLRRVTVNGEVKLPNVYMVDVTSSVRDAIARAGGLLESASRRSVVIMRGNERIKVPNWDRSQGPETDLVSGDQIVVGRKNWFVINALPVISTSVIVIGLIRSLRN